MSTVGGNKHKSDPLYKRIRLLRKKLKQIETLKMLPRKLNTEELAKVGCHLEKWAQL